MREALSYCLEKSFQVLLYFLVCSLVLFRMDRNRKFSVVNKRQRHLHFKGLARHKLSGNLRKFFISDAFGLSLIRVLLTFHKPLFAIFGNIRHVFPLFIHPGFFLELRRSISAPLVKVSQFSPLLDCEKTNLSLFLIF